MDVLAHASWSAIMYSQQKKYSLWLVALLGVAPDFLSFGPYFLTEIWNHAIPFGHRDLTQIPPYVYSLYNVTHSLIIWLLIGIALCVLMRRLVWEWGAWGLHIVIDIFSHSSRFFPTPFLWPVSNFHVNGVSWASPWFMAINYGLLVVIGTTAFILRRRKFSAKP